MEETYRERDEVPLDETAIVIYLCPRCETIVTVGAISTEVEWPTSRTRLVPPRRCGLRPGMAYRSSLPPRLLDDAGDPLLNIVQVELETHAGDYQVGRVKQDLVSAIDRSAMPHGPTEPVTGSSQRAARARLPGSR